jgi:hypothetical protein
MWCTIKNLSMSVCPLKIECNTSSLESIRRVWRLQKREKIYAHLSISFLLCNLQGVVLQDNVTYINLQYFVCLNTKIRHNCFSVHVKMEHTGWLSHWWYLNQDSFIPFTLISNVFLDKLTSVAVGVYALPQAVDWVLSSWAIAPAAQRCVDLCCASLLVARLTLPAGRTAYRSVARSVCCGTGK